MSGGRKIDLNKLSFLVGVIFKSKIIASLLD